MMESLISHTVDSHTTDSHTTDTFGSRPAFPTIVTAFMSQINARGDRPVQKYIDLGKALLSLHIRQIVFIERYIYETYLRNEYRGLGVGCSSIRFFTHGGHAYEYVVLGHLTFVFFERTDMYLEQYREMATEFSLNTPHPSKDTLDYMFVQCHKTEWVAMAISLDNNNNNNNNNNIDDRAEGICENAVAQRRCSRNNRRGFTIVSYYAWLDFGIRHMYPSVMAFDMAIYGLRDRLTLHKHESIGTCSSGVVYAPSCWSPEKQYTQDVYREIFWVFSGSAFGGCTKALLEFARRTKTKCIDILTTRRRLMWEVNVWYLVYRDCPGLFSLFYGNHNADIVTNWKL